jgi:hypothetical protein
MYNLLTVSKMTCGSGRGLWILLIILWLVQPLMAKLTIYDKQDTITFATMNELYRSSQQRLIKGVLLNWPWDKDSTECKLASYTFMRSMYRENITRHLMQEATSIGLVVHWKTGDFEDKSTNSSMDAFQAGCRSLGDVKYAVARTNQDLVEASLPSIQLIVFSLLGQMNQPAWGPKTPMYVTPDRQPSTNTSGIAYAFLDYQDSAYIYQHHSTNEIRYFSYYEGKMLFYVR